MPTLPVATCAALRAARFAPARWLDDAPARRDLDARLEPQHRARTIDHAVDQLDLRPLLDAYAGTGSRPHRPDLLLKAVLYELHCGRRSPAQWTRDARHSEPVRWLLRGCTPARSCWYAFRDRCGPLCDELNRQVLAAMARQQLSPATRAALDGTSVAADASRHRLVNSATLERRLEQLAAAVDQDQRHDTPTPPGPGWQAKTPQGRVQQLQRLQRAQEHLEQQRAQNRGRKKSKRRADERIVVSLSDPEAVLGRDKEGVFRPLYNVQIVRDLDSPFVLGYDVVGQLNDAGVLGPMLERTRALSGSVPQQLLVDSAYTGGADLAVATAAGVTVYGPWQAHDFSATTRKPPAQLPKQAFAWQEAEQSYLCPQGQRLTAVGTSQQARASSAAVQLTTYRCATESCQSCPQKPACCPRTKTGRTLSRSEHEGLVEALRERQGTVAGKELYRWRRQTVELVNADWKQHRGFRRLNGRGVARARCAVGLQVLAHNLVTLQAAEAKSAAARNGATADARTPLTILT